MPYGSSPGMVIACGGVRRRARRPVCPGACGMACRRIVCRRVRRWPVAGSRAVGPVAISRIVTSLSDSATSVSLPCPRSGIPKARRLPCPGPTYACSRRRQPLCCVWFHMSIPWRSIDARPAARLRRIVGPPSPRNTDAGRSHTDVPFCRTATIAYRSPRIGIGVRENRRSPPPMPNGDDRASIPTGHRPGIVRAERDIMGPLHHRAAGQNARSDET